MDGLRSPGISVVTCNAPWRATTAERLAALQRPTLALRLVGRLVRAWWALWRCSARIDEVDTVLVGYLGVLDVHLARRRFPRAQLWLDHLAPVVGTVQDRTGWSFGVRPRFAAGLDRAAVARSDLVLVDTDEHRAGLDASSVEVVPVGASSAWFDVARAPGAGEKTGPLRLVFFGPFTPLQGTSTVARAIRLALDELPRGSIEVTMIGSGQDERACRTVLEGYDDVAWQGWANPQKLPAMVARADVCLGIFGRTSKAARVVPNKVYQGAAAGCAIVTGDTEPQRRALPEAAVFVTPGDAPALARVLVERRRPGAGADTARSGIAAGADRLRAGSGRRAPRHPARGSFGDRVNAANRAGRSHSIASKVFIA